MPGWGVGRTEQVNARKGLRAAPGTHSCDPLRPSRSVLSLHCTVRQGLADDRGPPVAQPVSRCLATQGLDLPHYHGGRVWATSSSSCRLAGPHTLCALMSPGPCDVTYRQCVLNAMGAFDKCVFGSVMTALRRVPRGKGWHPRGASSPWGNTSYRGRQGSR